jgi:hypothetical protein
VLLELGRLVEVGQERSQGRPEVLLGGDLLLAVGQHLIRGFYGAYDKALALRVVCHLHPRLGHHWPCH